MQAIPILEIRDGRCVSVLAADRPAAWDAADPRAIVRSLHEEGFQTLHIVDLDTGSARGTGPNSPLIRDLIAETAAGVQLSGGARSEAAIEEWLGAGAQYVVPGPRFVEDESWRNEMLDAFPGRLILAFQVDDHFVNSRGWSAGFRCHISTFMAEAAHHDLAGLLATITSRAADDIPAALDVVDLIADSTTISLTIAGPLTATMETMRAIEHRGASAALIRELLYSDNSDIRTIVSEFPQLSHINFR